MHTYLPSFLILLGTVIFQTTIAPHLRIMGVQPDLILILTVTYAFIDGPVYGSALGFFGGLLQDFIIARNVGLNVISKTIVGYIAGLLKENVFIESMFLPVVAIFLASIVDQTIYLILGFTFGYQIPFKNVFYRVILPSAVYNSIFSFFIYPAYRRLIAYESRYSLLK
ncbi:MAG: rod shape-determining protein MreD [Actinobacteria bacterium]|nr:rod shape-determining protein MreD [Actinomycetota bacterium]